MYFIYALYNKSNDKIYIGQTNKPERRLKEHSRKFKKLGYTSKFEGEWILVYQESTSTRSEALSREKQLKSFKGREFVRSLINNKFLQNF